MRLIRYPLNYYPCRRRCSYHAVTGIYAVDTMNQIPMPCVVSSMLMPFSCPVVTVVDAHGTDTHKPDSDAVTGIHAADTTNQIPMPCVRHPLEVTGIHGTDTHGHAWHPVLVVLDTHGHNADTMNQIPIEPIPIPMPCVVSCRIIALYCNLWPCRRQCSCSRYHEPDTHAMCPASSGGYRHLWD